jgi:hypothetical protein
MKYFKNLHLSLYTNFLTNLREKMASKPCKKEK